MAPAPSASAGTSNGQHARSAPVPVARSQEGEYDVNYQQNGGGEGTSDEAAGRSSKREKRISGDGAAASSHASQNEL